jgi:hypothetical protein
MLECVVMASTFTFNGSVRIISKKGAAGRLRVRWVVDDPDALFEEFRGKGVSDDGTHVRDTSWGTRAFGFRDPDGNVAFYRDL